MTKTHKKSCRADTSQLQRCLFALSATCTDRARGGQDREAPLTRNPPSFLLCERQYPVHWLVGFFQPDGLDSLDTQRSTAGRKRTRERWAA